MRCALSATEGGTTLADGTDVHAAAELQRRSPSLEAVRRLDNPGQISGSIQGRRRGGQATDRLQAGKLFSARPSVRGAASELWPCAHVHIHRVVATEEAANDVAAESLVAFPKRVVGRERMCRLGFTQIRPG